MAKSFSKNVRIVLSSRTVPESSEKLYYGALYLNMESSGNKISLWVILQFPSTLNNFVLYPIDIWFWIQWNVHRCDGYVYAYSFSVTPNAEVIHATGNY